MGALRSVNCRTTAWPSSRNGGKCRNVSLRYKARHSCGLSFREPGCMRHTRIGQPFASACLLDPGHSPGSFPNYNTVKPGNGSRNWGNLTSISVQSLIIKNMVTTIAVILLILWLLGFITSYTLGGFIHVLLVVAIIMILVRLIRGENPIH
jgi:hypothetical protein